VNKVYYTRYLIIFQCAFSINNSITDKMKTVYIIGAGFSRYANLPLMSDFYFKSKDIYFRLQSESDKKSFERVFSYFDEYSKVKNIMDADFLNIEELLSIIEMDSYLTNKKGIYKDYINYLEKVIVLSSPAKINNEGVFLIDESKNTEVYTQFLIKVFGIIKPTDTDRAIQYYDRDPQNENGIISLNYDLLLEKSLKRLNDFNINQFGPAYLSFDFDYGLEEKFITRSYTSTPRYPQLKIAKIHGSINFKSNDIPIIIPRTWNKTSDKRMKPVWKHAYDLLSAANKIIFIGYSLAETDLYVKYLLISGLKQSYNLKEIEIICKDDNENNVQKRYEKFFDENFRKKAFSFHALEFETWMGYKPPTKPTLSKQW
jgi:hypothetical protein